MFNGPEYQPRRDFSRLKSQHDRIKYLMLDGKWRTVKEIHELTNDPENSIQAQLRHLRKLRFGGFIVDRRSVDGSALYEYRVLKPDRKHFAELLKIEIEAQNKELSIEKEAEKMSKTDLLRKIKFLKKENNKLRLTLENLNNGGRK